MASSVMFSTHLVQVSWVLFGARNLCKKKKLEQKKHIDRTNFCASCLEQDSSAIFLTAYHWR